MTFRAFGNNNDKHNLSPELIMSLRRLPDGNFPTEMERLVDVGIQMADDGSVSEAARFLATNEIPVKVINRVLFEPWLRRQKGRKPLAA